MKHIKRIIFDLDNTLIPWKKEYSDGFIKAIKDFNLDYDKNDDEVVAIYEKQNDNYNYEELLKCFNEVTGLNASLDFIKAWQDNLGAMAEVNPEINEVLEYLSGKYELVVLTNWFRDPQKKRLETARMCHYFKEVYGGDDYKKPSPNSYKKAIGNLKPSECLMIGDSLEEDIKGAINAGLKAIYLTNKKGKYDFPTIKNLKELKNIL